MAKAKKLADKDIASFIKKVASAGRGGDTELAFLSASARDLLKKLGGAGTKNPKTGLKEYKAASRFAKARAEEAEPVGLFGNTPVTPTAPIGPSPFSVAPASPFSMAPDTIAPQAEPEREPARGSAAADLQQLSVAPPARPTEQAQVEPESEPIRPQPGSAAADLQQFTNPPAQPQAAQPPASVPTNLNAAATSFNAAMAANAGQNTPQMADAAERARLRKEAREREDLYVRPIDSGIGDRPGMGKTGGRPGGFNPYDDEADRRAQEEAARRAAEEEARRAAEAEAEAARRAAEEEARRKAEEDARRAAEAEAARRAAEEQARRAAEEEARRRAEQDAAAARAAEEARRLAEENARRAAEEEARRRAEEARRAAEEEARRKAEEDKKNKPPGGGDTGKPGPGTGTVTAPPGLIDSKLPVNPPPITTLPPGGGGITFPPSSPPPLEKDKPIRTADFIDQNLNGIDDRDEEFRNPRTMEFRDRNRNGIDDRDEKPDTGKPSRGQFNFNWNAIDPNSDLGRLIGRIGRPPGSKKPSPGRGTPGGDKTPPPQTGRGLPSRPPPTTIPISPPTAGPPTTSPPGDGGYTPGPIPVTTLPKPGYVANPLPTAPGRGTSTPYFTPTPGSLTPGTVPANINLPSLQTSNLPQQALAQNPNLGPTMLGGAQNAGYYTDRFGNVILSPAAVRPPGRAKGGPASDKELLALLKGENKEAYAESMKNIDSARAMLENLSDMPGETTTEYSSTPISQTVRRATRRPIRQETDKGTARGMAMELESLTAAQGPKRAPDTLAELLKMSESVRSRDAMSAKDLMRDTFGEGRLTKKQLSRLGDLMTRRFAEGGEVDETDERMIPLHLRTYLASMLGGKTREPITEENLSGAELAKLRRLIELAKSQPVSSKKTGKALPGVVTYAHHDAYKNKYERLGGLPGPDTDKTLYSTANLRNTLGTFSFKEMPDGSYVVKDTYDFTGDVGEKDNWLIKQANKAGVNRPVKITLPSRKKGT